MKKRLCICLTLLFLLLSAHALCQESFLYVHNPVPTDRLHLRKGPSRGADSMGRFYNGTVVQLLTDEGDYCHVRIGAGEGAVTGYMMDAYLTKVPPESALDTAYVYAQGAAAAATLYQRPDAAASPCGQLADGVSVRILGDVEPDWVYVYHEDSNTYGYLSLSDAVRFPKGLTQPSEYRSDSLTHPQGKCVHLRSAPGTNARSLGSFYPSTIVYVYRDLNDWSFVSVGDLSGYRLYGYIRTRYLKKNTWNYATAPYATLTRDTPLLLKGADGADQLGTLLAGARVIVEATLEDYALVNVACDISGYLPLDALSLSITTSGFPRNRLFGAQGLCVVKQQTPLSAHATCDAYAPLVDVNSVCDPAGHFAPGDALILIADLGEWTQVFDGYHASFVLTQGLELLRTDGFNASIPTLKPGTYTAGVELEASLYTYVVEEGASGSLLIEGDGFTRAYSPTGPASYSFYLPEGARVTVGEGGVLTGFDDTRHESPFNAQYQSGRYLAGANFGSVDPFWATPLEGAEESYVVISTYLDDISGKAPERLPVKPGDEDGNRSVFFAPAGSFVEFVGCKIGTNG